MEEILKDFGLSRYADRLADNNFNIPFFIRILNAQGSAQQIREVIMHNTGLDSSEVLAICDRVQDRQLRLATTKSSITQAMGLANRGSSNKRISQLLKQPLVSRSVGAVSPVLIKSQQQQQESPNFQLKRNVSIGNQPLTQRRVVASVIPAQIAKSVEIIQIVQEEEIIEVPVPHVLSQQEKTDLQCHASQEYIKQRLVMLQREKEQSSQEENEPVDVIEIIQSTAHIEEEKHFDDTPIIIIEQEHHLQPEIPLSENTISNSSVLNQEVSPAKSNASYINKSLETSPVQVRSPFGKKEPVQYSAQQQKQICKQWDQKDDHEMVQEEAYYTPAESSASGESSIYSQKELQVNGSQTAFNNQKSFWTSRAVQQTQVAQNSSPQQVTQIRQIIQASSAEQILMSPQVKQAVLESNQVVQLSPHIKQFNLSQMSASPQPSNRISPSIIFAQKEGTDDEYGDESEMIDFQQQYQPVIAPSTIQMKYEDCTSEEPEEDIQHEDVQSADKIYQSMTDNNIEIGEEQQSYLDEQISHEQLYQQNSIVTLSELVFEPCVAALEVLGEVRSKEIVYINVPAPQPIRKEAFSQYGDFSLALDVSCQTIVKSYRREAIQCEILKEGEIIFEDNDMQILFPNAITDSVEKRSDASNQTTQTNTKFEKQVIVSEIISAKKQQRECSTFTDPQSPVVIDQRLLAKKVQLSPDINQFFTHKATPGPQNQSFRPIIIENLVQNVISEMTIKSSPAFIRTITPLVVAQDIQVLHPVITMIHSDIVLPSGLSDRLLTPPRSGATTPTTGGILKPIFVPRSGMTSGTLTPLYDEDDSSIPTRRLHGKKVQFASLVLYDEDDQQSSVKRSKNQELVQKRQSEDKASIDTEAIIIEPRRKRQKIQDDFNELKNTVVEAKSAAPTFRPKRQVAQVVVIEHHESSEDEYQIPKKQNNNRINNQLGHQNKRVEKQEQKEKKAPKPVKKPSPTKTLGNHSKGTKYHAYKAVYGTLQATSDNMVMKNKIMSILFSKQK